MKQTSKTPVWVVCDTCPCFNLYELQECALTYEVVLLLHNKSVNRKGNRIEHASECCELIEIRTKTEIIKPEIFENLGG